MTVNECLFCNEIKSGKNIIAESDLFTARWDQIPLMPGHAEVLPKRHVQYFDELAVDEIHGLLVFAKEVMELIRRADLVAEYEAMLQESNDFVRPHIEQAIKKAANFHTPPDGFNHGLNDGPEAGQSIPHLHYHLIPRWKGDVPNPRGGIRRMFGEDEYSNG